MKVLVACEFSGIVRDAFAARGHDAWSCDLLPSERPGNHIQGDVLELLSGEWDMMLAFPPCAHLAASGAQYWPAKKADGRQQFAVEFVRRLWNAPIERIAIENPVGILSSAFARPTQKIEPCHFGDPFLKKTCLWLKNLPTLIRTNRVAPAAHWCSSSHRSGNRKKSALPVRHGDPRNRSRTFQGVANAMAEQWSMTTFA